MKKEKGIYVIGFPIFSKDLQRSYICISHYMSWKNQTSFGCSCSEFEKVNGKWKFISNNMGMVE